MPNRKNFNFKRKVQQRRVRRRQLRVEQLELRRVLASVSGTVFTDLDNDGIYEPGAGETPLANESVFVDLDNNGTWGDTARLIEPDNFVDKAILNDRTPGVTLSAANGSNQPSFDVTSNVDSLASTGGKVFGHSNIPFFNSNRRLRVDFHGPGRSIAVDFIGSSSTGTEVGRLEIYDKDDQLLGAYQTSPLGQGAVDTMSLFRAEGDIAYAVAFSPSGLGNFARLDNLRYNHLGLTAEPSTLTDANGNYTLTIPDVGHYSIVHDLDDGVIQTGPTRTAIGWDGRSS